MPQQHIMQMIVGQLEEVISKLTAASHVFVAEADQLALTLFIS